MGGVPLIDTKNTTIAHNVTSEEFERMPKGRSFQNLAWPSPSVNTGDIEGGFQVNGASGGENTFTVDGVSTNSLVDGPPAPGCRVRVPAGSAGQDLRHQAEYGGALGGVISAVTKSGGNAYHGRGPLLLRRRHAAPMPRPAGPLARRRRHRAVHRRTRAAEQPARLRRIARRPDREGPSVLLRIVGRHATSGGRTTTSSPVASTGHDDQKQTINSAFGKVSYDPTSRLHTSFSTLWTPTRRPARFRPTTGWRRT